MMSVRGNEKFAENNKKKWRRIWLNGRNQDGRLQKASPTTDGQGVLADGKRDFQQDI